MSRWIHYVGGYYSPLAFIREAQRIGINRACAPNAAKTLAFGDTVILMYWNDGAPQAFAEFLVSRVAFLDGIGAEVGQSLADTGRAEACGGFGWVKRKCGSYYDAGGYCVHSDVTLAEMVEAAIKIAAERKVKLKCFIGGYLSAIHPTPREVQPAPKFSRGFIRVQGSAWASRPTGIIIGNEDGRQIRSLTGYNKRNGVGRRDPLTPP